MSKVGPGTERINGKSGNNINLLYLHVVGYDRVSKIFQSSTRVQMNPPPVKSIAGTF